MMFLLGDCGMNEFLIEYLKQSKAALSDAKRYCDNAEEKAMVEELLALTARVICDI
jgi:hypothetical protein